MTAYILALPDTVLRHVVIAAAGYPPDSELDYAEAVGLLVPKGYKGHEALSDARLTRVVWSHFLTKKFT
jgi:hypothetical protein